MKVLLLSILLLQVSLTSCDQRSPNDMGERLKKNLPNSMVYFGAEDEIPKMPAVIQSGLKNGLRCEAKKVDAEADLGNAFYEKGASEFPEDKKNTTLEELKKKYGVDCDDTTSTSEAYTCACVHKKFLIYCGLIAQSEKITKEMGGVEADCNALDRLKNTGTGMLGVYYDYDKAKDNEKIFQQVFDSEVEQALASLVAFGGALCDSLNPQVETAVKDLMKLDFKYTFVEILLGVVVYGAAAKEAAAKRLPFDHSKVCETDDYKTGFGLCICKSDVGIQFCFFKAIAEEFKKNGYLDCTGVSATNKQPKLDAAKKPSSLPVMIKGRAKKSAATAAAATALLASLAAVLIR